MTGRDVSDPYVEILDLSCFIRRFHSLATEVTPIIIDLGFKKVEVVTIAIAQIHFPFHELSEQIFIATC